MKNLQTELFLSMIVLSLISLNISVNAQNNLGQTGSNFMVLNEIEVNNPGADLPNCEYVEVRGDPNTTVVGRVFLIEVEGDDTFAGIVNFVRELTGESFGTNGLITITGPSQAGITSKKRIITNNGIQVGPCGSRDYQTQGTTFFEDFNVNFQNGTTSFLLVRTIESSIQLGSDIDPQNGGTADGLPGDAIIVDAVGWTDGDAGDFVYGGVDITPGNTSGSPDAATRNHSDITPLSRQAWFSDDLVGISVDTRLYDQANLFGGYLIDFITPGRLNLAPSAASAFVSGRVLGSNGRGLRFVTVMITGNGLPEPLYATTNMFGRYQFEDIPVGETYVLHAFSKRYTFDQSSLVINVNDNISNADFIGGEPR
jgi:hypothetical protein